MAIIFIGARETQGEFQNKPYHNLNFYYAQNVPEAEGIGFEINKEKHRAKIKWDDIESVFGEGFDVKSLNKLLYKPCQILFDSYNNAKFIRFES